MCGCRRTSWHGRRSFPGRLPEGLLLKSLNIANFQVEPLLDQSPVSSKLCAAETNAGKKGKGNMISSSLLTRKLVSDTGILRQGFECAGRIL